MRALPVTPSKPKEFTFVWDASADLERGLTPPITTQTRAAKIDLLLTALEQGRQSEDLNIGPRDVGNDPPRVPSLAVDENARSGLIPLIVKVSDSTSDPVSMAATFRLSDSEKWGCMTIVGARLDCGAEGDAGSPAPFETEPQGRTSRCWRERGVEGGRTFQGNTRDAACAVTAEPCPRRCCILHCDSAV